MHVSAQKNNWHQRWQVVLEHILRIETEPVLDQLLASLKQTKAPLVLAFVNAHAMNSIVHSTEFFDAIKSADVVVRDGSGMATLYNMLGVSPGLNLNGTDLIPRIMRSFDGKKIALYGTQKPFLGNAQNQINKELAPGSEIVIEHGFHQAETYLTHSQKYRPSLIVLGMGMPKQEQVAVQLRAAINFPCLIVCGGAIIDFLGGKTSRAPQWMRSLGIEWLYRLVLEPRRLFKRYVIGNPLFLIFALRFKTVQRRKLTHSE